MQLKIEQYKNIARFRKTLLLLQTLHDKGISKKIGRGDFVAKAEAMPDDMPPSTFSHLMRRGIAFGVVEQNEASAYRLKKLEITKIENVLASIDPKSAPPFSYNRASAFFAPFATFRGWLACMVVADAGEINLGGICYACSLFCQEHGIKAKNGGDFYFHQGNMSSTMKSLVKTGVIKKSRVGRDSIHFVNDAEKLEGLAGVGG